jgi:hypothetical protein
LSELPLDKGINVIALRFLVVRRFGLHVPMLTKIQGKTRGVSRHPTFYNEQRVSHTSYPLTAKDKK